MSKIFDLINELCPNGVEFRELGEIFQRIKGTNITANKMKEIEVHGGDIRIFAGGKTVIDTTEDKIQNPNITRVPSVIVQSRGVIDFIYYDKPFTFKNEMWGYTSENETSIKFLYYYLKNNISYFRAASISMGALPQISLPITEKFKLPVPPMEVQREIVRILDSFTLLTAELTARKKQYEFYRDFLLSFDELDKNGGGCELKMLGEICDLIAGGDISKDKVSKEKDIKFKFPIYSNGIGDNALYGFTDEPRVMKQCVTISARGTIGYCALRLDPFYPIVRLICAIPKSNITAQFLKYFLDTQKISVPTSGISQLTIPMVAKIKIPVPSLQTQQKVVDILDKFDTLVNSITEGLPREIELRRKQYEYYRKFQTKNESIKA